MSDSIYFLNPNLILPTEEQLSKISNLSEKMDLKRNEILGFLDKSGFQDPIFIKSYKYNEYNINANKELQNNKSLKLRDKFIVRSNNRDTILSKFDISLNKKAKYYFIISLVAMFLIIIYFSFFNNLNIDQKEVQSVLASEKPNEKIKQKTNNEKQMSHYRDLEKHKNKITGRRKIANNKQIGNPIPSDKGLNKDLKIADNQGSNKIENKIEVNTPKKSALEQKKLSNKLLKIPSMDSLIKVEKYTNINKFKSDGKIVQNKDFNLFYPQKIVSKPVKLFFKNLNIYNQNIKMYVKTSFKKESIYKNLSNSKPNQKLYYLFLFSLKVNQYNYSISSNDLQKQIELLANILGIKAIITDSYDVEISISNQYNQSGRIIWTLGQVFYTVSKSEKLNLKDIDSAMVGINYILNHEQSNIKNIIPLLTLIKSYLKQIKMDFNNTKARLELKSLIKYLSVDLLKK
ncbi:MAG: hypothetical protein OEV44_03800 [Spirochaetota bacterium]|nr:hypothetical protein [Spirochaetota bacterium]